MSIIANVYQIIGASTCLLTLYYTETFIHFENAYFIGASVLLAGVNVVKYMEFNEKMSIMSNTFFNCY